MLPSVPKLPLKPPIKPQLARSAKALESAYRNLGSRLGRADRPTEVTALFVAAAAVALTAAGALGRLSVPGLP